MGKRKDGLDRKALLLEAATKVFARKGYGKTTIADICQAAKSNTASVNYYFGSKEELYAEVWKGAFQNAIDRYPPDMELLPDAPAEDKLRAFIKSLLHRMLDSGELGYAGQILLMEMANPTETIDHIKRDAIEPMRKRMMSIVQQLLGNSVCEETLAFCAMSVIHQCMGFGFRRGKLPPPLRDLDKNRLIEMLSEHITLFSLAGIASVKEATVQIPQRA
jgi:AcrR family transcriptional regulator